MQKQSVVFIGQEDCSSLERTVIIRLLEELIQLGYTEFYSCGLGNFDLLCSECVFRLKNKYPRIKSVLLVPYLDYESFHPEYFDFILYSDRLSPSKEKNSLFKSRLSLLYRGNAVVWYGNHQEENLSSLYTLGKKLCLPFYRLNNTASEAN